MGYFYAISSLAGRFSVAYSYDGGLCGGAVSLIYKNGENRIKFEYGFANGKFAYIDNEQSWYEVLTSDGIEYHCYLSDDKSFYDKISWCESGYYFVVSAHISKEDIIKIAENIKK